jgi:long-chain fatty acid transport protein
MRFLSKIQYFITLLLIGFTTVSFAGGGYFSIGYGPTAKQTAGAVTAVAGDAYAGASNPAKLTASGNKFEIGTEIFNPYREVKRTGATGPAAIYNFKSKSRNSLFLIPEMAYSHQVNDKLAVGVTAYANGGLNSEYNDTTGIPGTSASPAACGVRPGNFFGGCGEAGFDLAQLIIAPTVAWEVAPGHSIGVAPLIAIQRYKAFGLQAFQGVSRYPNNQSNKGYDHALGAGVRIGWFGEITPWLSLGAAYATKVYMQDFDKYKGLFTDGSFDIPANYSIGAAIKPNDDWLIAVDVQRIMFKDVGAVGNSLLNSLVNPVSNPLGDSSGSGFGWSRDQTNYRLGVTHFVTPRLTLRGGYAYGERANGNGLKSTTFSLLTPNPIHQATLGLSWKTTTGDEMHFALIHYFEETLTGPSALFPGARESVTPHVNAVSVTYSWALSE